MAGVVASAGGASGGSDAWKPASAPEVLPGEDLPREIRDLPLTLGVPGVMGTPSSVAASDLDGDGDQDLVSTNFGGNNLTVFSQLSPGSFSTLSLTLGGPGVTNRLPSVAAADLDGDGDQNLVSANESSSNLTLFFQLSPGRFPAPPLTLGGLTTTRGPNSVAAVDLDGDGDQDLISANAGGNNLTVFFGGR